MHIEIAIPEGQGLEPGVTVKVRIDGGEPQESVVQPASYYSGMGPDERFDVPASLVSTRQR